MRAHPLKVRLARWALPPAALAAIGCFAAHEVDPAAAAEGAYLGRLAAAVLVAVAALAPPPAAELGLGAALAVAAVWALPAGPGRGAAVMALLAASLAVAVGRQLLRLSAITSGSGGTDPASMDRHSVGPSAAAGADRTDTRSRPPGSGGFGALGALSTSRGSGGSSGSSGSSGSGRIRLGAAIALCFGCQVLLRGELLFAPGRSLRPWMALVALPVAAGAALALLWRRRGLLPALAAATVAAVLAPGWTVATTLALVALAGGASLPGAGEAPSTVGTGEPRLPAPAPRTTWRAWPIWASTAAWPAWARVTPGLLALALPIAWEPRAGWAMALAGLAVWRPGLAASGALALAAVTRGAALAGLNLPGPLAAHASWHEGAAALAWLVMLVPAALPAARQRRSRTLLVAALLLASATPWLPNRSALAAPLALAALALPATGAAAGLAAVWSAALLLGTTLLASYPWLRQDPLADALALIGGGDGAGPRLAAAIGAGAILLTAVTGVALRRTPKLRQPARAAPAGLRTADLAGLRMAGLAGRRTAGLAGARPAAAAGRRAATAAGIALFAALVGPRLASPSTALLDGGDAVLLDGGRPLWRADLGLGRIRGLELQTSLVNAAGLAAGTPVARIRLLGTGFAPVELQLRAGEDTGEWAARRPDLAATSGLIAPRPWLAWVAGDFFGQRYRTRLRLPRAGSYARVEIDLAAGLPPTTGLALYQVDLER